LTRSELTVLNSAVGSYNYEPREVSKQTGIAYDNVVRIIKSLVERRILDKICTIKINPIVAQWVMVDKIKPTPKEERTPVNPLFDELFRKFLAIYPRNTRLKETHDAWKKLNPSIELANKIIAHVEMRKGTEDWKKDNGKWIPSSYNFIAKERWNDEIKVVKDWRMK
jgi:hypothetical protein